MNKVLWILVGLFCVCHANADENDFRCFKSQGMKKPLRLEFVFVAGKDGAGYVRYENGSGTIPVKRTTEKELRKGAAGRPSEFESRWVEVPSDGKGGTYVIVSQGAVVNSLRYIRRDGKAFTFQEDDDAAGSSGCEWR